MIKSFVLAAGSLFLASVVCAQPNGDKPIKGVSMFVYHTDAKGIYQRETNDNPYDARLWGVMRTDANGRYEYKTIRPASYPNTRFPAHVHHAIHAADYKVVFPEFNFDDDPFVNDTGKREGAARLKRPLLKMKQDQEGVWHGEFDIVLERI